MIHFAFCNADSGFTEGCLLLEQSLSWFGGIVALISFDILQGFGGDFIESIMVDYMRICHVLEKKKKKT